MSASTGSGQELHDISLEAFVAEMFNVSEFCSTYWKVTAIWGHGLGQWLIQKCRKGGGSGGDWSSMRVGPRYLVWGLPEAERFSKKIVQNLVYSVEEF